MLAAISLSLLLVLALVVIVISAAWIAIAVAIRKIRPQSTGYGRPTHSEQMEVDLRLTYKRFKQIYPFSKITYQQYKQMQMERAFKRAVSSEKNKRMVR